MSQLDEARREQVKRQAIDVILNLNVVAAQDEIWKTSVAFKVSSPSDLEELTVGDRHRFFFLDCRL